jgi:hypothetical protein
VAKKPRQNPKLLAEIAQNYQYALEYWTPIHKEGNTDVKFIAGDPWDPRDIQARETMEQKRPHLVFDEGSQYINQFVGQSMQQARAVKVEPLNDDADMDDATVLQERIQHIDYSSRGQTHAIKALADCAKRGYGWMSMRKCYTSEDKREQEPCWNPVPNPDSRLMDPDAKEVDGSDMEFCFVRDIVKKTYVKKKYPLARNLGKETDRNVILVEYWKVDKEIEDQVLWLDDPTVPGGIEVKKSALPESAAIDDEQVMFGEGQNVYSQAILDAKDIEKRTVTKYICQIADPGSTVPQWMPDSDASEVVEILEFEEWPGKWIPEVPVFGPKEYINEGGAQKVTILSMLRRARDPMQLLNLTGTNAAELVSMTPKTRAIGYEGQFEGHEDEWANIGSSPLAFLQVKPIVDPTSNQVLPLPTLMQWEPPIQALMILWNECKNQIRSAVGQLASPELDKGKSGIAIQKIQTEGASAVYHITEAYSKSMEQVGRVEGDLIEKTHDTKRQVATRKADGTGRVVTINAPYEDENKQRQHYKFTEGAFNYTITTGPSYQSQFEQASDFVDKLVASVPALFLDGQGQTIVGDLFIKIKRLGPIGDLLVERFKKMLKPGLEDTAIDIPPQAKAELQKGQQVINALTQQNNELKQVIQNKVIERESEDGRNKRDNETKIAIATINASVKENIAQLEAVMDNLAQNLNNQFEMMMAKVEAQQNPAGNGGSAPNPPATEAAASNAPPASAGMMVTTPGPPQPTPTHIFDPASGEIQPVQ